MQELLYRAVKRGIITQAQADQLLHLFTETAEAPAATVNLAASGPGFTFTNVLYYLGGLIAIGAMTLFMTLGWQTFGGWGMGAIAVIYAAAALAASRYLLNKGFSTPAGILAALAIALVPLAIYGFEEALQMWPTGRPYRDFHYWIDWRWAWMEIGTLTVGSVILYLFRLPFAVMPIAVTLWYMSMDFAPLLAGGADPDWHVRKQVSVGFGVLMLLAAFYVDIRSKRRPDYAFWLYFFGTFSSWGALSLSDSSNQVGKLLYACLNVGMIFLGAVLARRIFTVCGGLGLCGYLGYLSYSVFKDSIFFPIALTLLGLGLVGGGIWWQRHEVFLHARFRGLLPDALRSAI